MLRCNFTSCREYAFKCEESSQTDPDSERPVRSGPRSLPVPAPTTPQSKHMLVLFSIQFITWHGDEMEQDGLWSVSQWKPSALWSCGLCVKTRAAINPWYTHKSFAYYFILFNLRRFTSKDISYYLANLATGLLWDFKSHIYNTSVFLGDNVVLSSTFPSLPRGCPHTWSYTISYSCIYAGNFHLSILAGP